MTFDSLNIDHSWTLFLDRDGVINEMLPDDYVKTVAEFKFIEGVPEAISILSTHFSRIFIVTNQRGIGRSLMSQEDLSKVHEHMKMVLEAKGGRIDDIFFCPHDYDKEVCNCRKPGIGMPMQAQAKYPEIDFSKSMMIGDSLKDVQMGNTLGMFTIGLGPSKETFKGEQNLYFLNLIGMVTAFNEAI